MLWWKLHMSVSSFRHSNLDMSLKREHNVFWSAHRFLGRRWDSRLTKASYISGESRRRREIRISPRWQLFCKKKNHSRETQTPKSFCLKMHLCFVRRFCETQIGWKNLSQWSKTVDLETLTKLWKGGICYWTLQKDTLSFSEDYS
jgi:hypothetical protein